MLLARSFFLQYSVPFIIRKIRLKVIMPYYAVARGKTPGIYLTWEDCKSQVYGFERARYKKFNTPAEAQTFINENRCKDLPGIKVTKTIVYPNSASTSTASSSTSHVSSNMGDDDDDDDISRVLIDGEQHQEELGLQEQPRSLSPTLLRMQEDLKKLNKKAKQLQKQFDAYVKFKAGNRTRRSSGQQRRHLSTDTSSSTTGETENSIYQTDEMDGSSDGGQGPSGQGMKRRNSAEQQSLGSKRMNNANPRPDNLVLDEEGYLVVYTDGACTNNGYSGAQAGLGVWFNHNHPLNLASPVTGRATNNVGEIQGATKAVQIAKANGFHKVKIITDSQFLISSITKWIHGWKRNGWRLSSGGPVKNRVNFEELDSEIRGVSIKWEHCPGHAGIIGNECADALARRGAELYGRS